ncbi:MAG: hypothetical protein Q4D87_05575 [Actinomycetaceae bacterium]|nr:hypothetical protein [Actinomycetaceae bacterium]
MDADPRSRENLRAEADPAAGAKTRADSEGRVESEGSRGSEGSFDSDEHGDLGGPAVPAVESRPARKKQRRRAERISEADKRIIAAGGRPSWEQIRTFEPDFEPDSGPSRANRATGSVGPNGAQSARDREMLENKPPHW